MPASNNQKNKEYVVKHKKSARAEMGDEQYRKKEAAARALRRQKGKRKKAQQELTLPLLKS